MPNARRDALWILTAMLATTAAFRAYLYLVDHNSDFFIYGYNVHHLFIGAVLSLAASMLLAIGESWGVRRRIVQVVLGAGAAMVLDEIVFLIATDGSNDAYLTAPSWVGALVFVAMAAAWIILLGWRGRRTAE